MKLASFITFTLALFCLIMRYPLNYWFGYYESYTPWKLQIVCLLVGYILIPVMFIIWIISLFKKKHRLWTAIMLIGLLVFTGLKQKLPNPDNLLIWGMRNRMMRDYSLDILRRFAHDFDQLPRLPNDLPGTTKGYMNADLTRTDLKKKYPFLGWLKGPGGFEGPSSIAETDGVVDVRWGGLDDHWGFSVAVNGKSISPQEPDAKILRVSDDFYFIIER